MLTITLNRGVEAIVDDDEYDEISKYSWYVTQEGYARRAIKIDGKQSTEYMHRVIVKAPKGFQVDHINGNTRDNRKENLRICTARQNQFNSRKNKPGTSRFKGVHWHKSNRKWTANIMANKKRIHLGNFDNEIDAAKAYNEAALKHFGEFARINVV